MSSLVKPVKPAAPNQHSCTTKGRFDEFSIKWTIEDAYFYLSQWMDSRYYGHNLGQMESAVNFTNNGERQWKLVIKPRSKSDNKNWPYDEYTVYLDVSLVLVNVQTVQTQVFTNFSLSIIDGHGGKMNTRKQPTKDISQSGLLDSYIKLDDLLSNENLLPNDTLTLLCEVKALVSSRTETSSVATSRTLPALEQLHIPD